MSTSKPTALAPEQQRSKTTLFHLYSPSPVERRLDPKARGRLVRALNRTLAMLVDLRAQSKQAHWNVRGPHFRSLHKLFDNAHDAADAFVDRTAERVAQLDGVVGGTLQDAVRFSPLAAYPTDVARMSGVDHVRHLAAQFSRASDLVNDLAAQAAAHGDEGTNTLLGEAVEQLDKLRWMLSATLLSNRHVGGVAQTS